MKISSESHHFPTRCRGHWKFSVVLTLSTHLGVEHARPGGLRRCIMDLPQWFGLRICHAMQGQALSLTRKSKIPQASEHQACALKPVPELDPNSQINKQTKEVTQGIT